MVEKILRFFNERRTLFWSLVIGITLMGVFAFVSMPKLEDPAVGMKQLMIAVPYPGATAHEVELNVAQIVEEQLRQMPKVKKVVSECQKDLGMFTVEFEMDLQIKDIEQAFDLARRKMNDIKMSLPNGCMDPIVIDDMLDTYGILYALVAEDEGFYSYKEMDRYAKYIKRELLQCKGVKRINIVGARSEVINIIFDKEQIGRNGMLPTQVMMEMQQVAKPVSAGNYQAGDDRLQMRISDPKVNEEDIANMLIKTTDGKMVKLSQIAKVERTYQEPFTNGFFVDNKPALAICVTMEADAIVPNVGKLTDQALANAMKSVPNGLRTEKIFFQSEKVDKAVNSFMYNLLESVAIVVLALIFAMGWRSGLIIGMGLVLSIAASFPILLECGTTLQRISLGAFIVAMGMLVDNSVVIMDGILVDQKKGLKNYLYRIGNSTAMPLLGATIIAAGTFISVYLSPDTVGEYAADLFLVIFFSLILSWIFALIQVPICYDAWSRKKLEKNQEEENQNDNKAQKFVRKSIAKLIDHRYITITVVIAVLVVCLFCAGKIKNMFFPDFDYDQFVVECFMPAQTNPDKVKETLFEMNDLVKKHEGVRRVSSSMGSAPAHYCLVRPMTNGGSCYGELMVDCDDYDAVCKVIPEVRRQLREKYPDCYIRFRKYNFSIGTSHTVEVEFTGPDPQILKKLANQAEDIMRDCKLVDRYSVQNNWKPSSMAIMTKYNEQNALRSGVSRGDIAASLQAATDGKPIGVIKDQDQQVIINLMVRNADGSRIENIADIPVWTTMNIRPDDIKDYTSLVMGTGADKLQDRMFRSVPLGNITDQISTEFEEEVVRRLNGRRVIEAECDPDFDQFDATPASVMADIKDKIEAIPLPEGYNLRWVGQDELQGEAMMNIAKYIPIQMFIILLTLLLLFNSWKKVGLILLCIPFSFVGVVPALLLTSQPFTFMAMVGLYGLVGMMIKNAIVLVDEINRLIEEEGLNPYQAILDATVSRVRPVLMASVTTIAGMIPLLGDPMYGSMAIAIIGGLAVGTVITLILMPLFYAAMYHIRRPKTEEKEIIV